MVNFDSSSLTVWLLGFVVVAVLATVLAVAALTDTLVRNRRVRLARHQSVRRYYGGLVLSH